MRTTLLRVLVLSAIVFANAVPLASQEQNVVEELALLLQAEDSRRWDGPLFESSLNHPSPQVRRTAAMGIGRIGDWRGTPLLILALTDRDTTVQTTVMFALGLLEDPAAVEAIIDRLRASPNISSEPAVEGISALAKIGGPEAGTFMDRLLGGSARVTVEDPESLKARALIDAWRLRDDAPITQLLVFVDDQAEDWRWRSLFSLARLRTPAAGDAFLRALSDPSPIVRTVAAGALTRRFVGQAGIDATTCTDLLARAINDADPGVQIAALKALGSFRNPETSAAMVVSLDAVMPNVRVQAARSLGFSGGPLATRELTRVATERESFAVAREALLGLAKFDSMAFIAVAPGWASSRSWRDRMIAAEGWEQVAPGPGPGKPLFLQDGDPRVVAAALRGWIRGADQPGAELATEARLLITHEDAVVRAAAATALGKVGEPRDVQSLSAMFRRAQSDSIPDAALAALDALLLLAEASAEGESAVLMVFLGPTPRPNNYVIRGWAEDNWPAALERWGPAYPLDTGFSLQDYRAVAERFLVNQNEAYPHVFVETDNNGSFEIELFGPEAPLTVLRFLGLVDRHFFDGNQWHRVVPNFVAQDGDPRGDGWGQAPGAIRDEINRRRFRTRYVGLAASGPDTGSSQWFITLSPQPQLDGTYTVFGRIVGPARGLQRLTQGDRIRSIRR